MVAFFSINLNDIQQCLTLLLLDTNMHWCCFQVINKVNINQLLFDALRQYLFGHFAIFIIFHQEKMNNVCSYYACYCRINRKRETWSAAPDTELHHPVCYIKSVTQNGNMDWVTVLLMIMIQVRELFCIFALLIRAAFVNIIIVSLLFEFQDIKQDAGVFRGRLA